MGNDWIATGDWHLGLNKHHDADVMRAVEAMRERSSRLMFLGDLFHTWRPTPETMRLGMDLLSMFERWLVIDGNHDNDAQGNAVSVLSSNMIMEDRDSHAVPENEELNCDAIMLDDWYVWMTCHGGRLPNFESGGHHSHQSSIVMLHGALPGSRMGAERDIETGHPTLEVPPVPLVLAGHMHSHQQYNVGDTLVFYPGAPSRTSHAEEKERKGFGLLTLEPGNFKIKFVRLPHARKFRTFSFSHVPALNDLLSLPEPSGSVRLRIKSDGSIDRRAIRLVLLEAGFDSASVEVERTTRGKGTGLTVRRTGMTLKDAIVRYCTGSRTGKNAARLVLDELSLEPEDPPECGTPGRLTELHVRDFQDIGSLDAELSDGLTAVVGSIGGDPRRSNGAGKSTVLAALRFLFTGRTPHLNSMSVRDGSDGATVSGVVMFGNDAYRIKRSIRRNGASSAEIGLNGDRIAGLRTTEVNAWLERNAGCGSWSELHHLSGGRTVLDMRPADRLAELMRDLPDLSGACYTLKKRLAGLREKLRSSETDLERLPDRAVRDAESERNALRASVAKRKLDLEDLDRAAESAKKRADDARELEELTERLVDDGAGAVLGEMRARHDKCAAEIDRLRVDLGAVTADLEFVRIGLGLLENSETCPLCFGRITDPGALLEKYRKRERAAEKKRNALHRRISKTETEHINLEASYLEETERTARTDGEQSEVKRRIAELKKRLPGGASADELNERLTDLYHERSHAKRDLEKAGGELALAEKSVDDAREALARKKELKNEIRRLKSEIKEHELAVECASIRGAPLLLLEDRLLRINAAASEIAEDLGTWRGMRIEARLSEDGNSIDFWSALDGRELPVELRSTGEKAVCNLIWQAARREVRERDGKAVLPLLLIDEVLDRMDAENQDAVVGWLRECGLQVLLVSHSARLRELVQERIELGVKKLEE